MLQYQAHHNIHQAIIAQEVINTLMLHAIGKQYQIVKIGTSLHLK